ncbi:hypothetical protein LUR56_38290 [Streptomyces sp. MT29]|nr:hypothetical protein [Streptomyces sp. MT29]
MTARLDPGRGWYGVFTRRDPQGMRSCLDGVEIPPWDVVESLLADLAEVHGAYFAEQVSYGPPRCTPPPRPPTTGGPADARSSSTGWS